MILDNLIISIEAVAPMFIVMAVGVLVRRRGMLGEEDVKRMNKMVFNVLFPVLMFSNLYGKEIKSAADLKLMITAVTILLTLYLCTFVFVLHIEKDRKCRGAMIQAIYRSNFVIMGIPIVENIFGSDNLALTSVMITVIVPIYNVLAVITLEIFRGGKLTAGHVAAGILKNPLIMGAIIGLLAVVTNLKLPYFAENTVDLIAGAATPMALLLLGASFNINSVEKYKKKIIVCVIGRLVVIPAIALSVGVMMGFRDMALVTLICIFAAPTAVSSFTMAQQMDSDAQLAGNCVIFSSMFSCLTMFCWIFALKSMGMF